MNSYQIIKKWMKENREKIDPPHQIHRYAWMRDRLRGSVFSIGCGEAKVEEYLLLSSDGNFSDQPIGGADINHEYVASASKRWPDGKFFCADITQPLSLPVPDVEYNTVIFSEIIEHIHPFSIHRALSECLRICRENVLITTPNAGHRDTLAEIVYSSDHCSFMTREALENLLNPAPVNAAWFVNMGLAKHGFNYFYEITTTDDDYFLCVEIKKR